MGKLFTRVGSAAMLAGASLFVIGGQAHASNSPALTPFTPQVCQSSANSGNDNNAAFSDYFFVVVHNNIGKEYCQLDGHVKPGDFVFAYYTAGDEEGIAAASLAAYNAPDGSSVLTNQTLSDCASTDSADASTCTGLSGVLEGYHYLSVQAPDCGFQVDFVFGKVITDYSTGETYHGDKTFIDADSKPSSGDCGSTPTPTPTSTPTSTPTPTPTPTGTPTPTPDGGVQGINTTPTPTATPTGSVLGISTPSTGASAGSNLGTDVAAFALLFIGFLFVGLARRRPVELS